MITSQRDWNGMTDNALHNAPMLTASEFFSRAQRRLTFDVPAGLADPHVIPRHDDHADPAVVIAILVALKLLRREGDGPDGTYCNTPEGAGIWLGRFRAKEQPDLGGDRAVRTVTA